MINSAEYMTCPDCGTEMTKTYYETAHKLTHQGAPAQTRKMMFQKSFGMHVELIFNPLRYGKNRETLRNVTEVHYNYSRGSYPSRNVTSVAIVRNVRAGTQDLRIAFESNIHSTGVTYGVAEIAEFIVTPETEIAESF